MRNKTIVVSAKVEKDTPPIMNSLPHILGSAGILYGLYYAHQHKSGFWGYVGYGLLGSVAGSVGGGIIKEVLYPKV